MQDRTVIGRAEKADFSQLGLKGVPVKIDTGADACSIWAHATEIDDKKLRVVFFGLGSPWYTGKEHTFMPDEYSITRVANSFGHKELRYKIKLQIKVKGRRIRGTFTLSDRSNKLYPVLIGRSLLKNKFVVDVAKGSPLRAEEREREQRLQEEMVKVMGGEK